MRKAIRDRLGRLRRWTDAEWAAWDAEKGARRGEGAEPSGAAQPAAGEAASDPGAGAVSTGWARRFGAADADVAAARDVILDVVAAAAERRRSTV